ncbi:hypothetical protein BVRB_6g146330 [Beta vulgaris subsp. vulgaris]|nr:hypothetical protein BVRB_6g146330 [Beta vulgaris subsp. vulgaris]
MQPQNSVGLSSSFRSTPRSWPFVVRRSTRRSLRTPRHQQQQQQHRAPNTSSPSPPPASLATLTLIRETVRLFDPDEAALYTSKFIDCSTALFFTVW